MQSANSNLFILVFLQRNKPNLDSIFDRTGGVAFRPEPQNQAHHQKIF